MRIFDISQSELLRACSLNSKIAKEQVQSSLLNFVDTHTNDGNVSESLYKICTGLYSIQKSTHSIQFWSWFY